MTIVFRIFQLTAFLRKKYYLSHQALKQILADIEEKKTYFMKTQTITVKAADEKQRK